MRFGLLVPSRFSNIESYDVGDAQRFYRVGALTEVLMNFPSFGIFMRFGLLDSKSISKLQGLFAKLFGES